MDAQKPKIPTLKDAKSTKPDFKIKGLSALSFMERLKQFKKKDLAFIAAGLGVLFMAPLVEHFMMAPESGDPSKFAEGFGSRPPNGIGTGGSPYEGGYNGLAPGGLLGSGSDVITPLNVRDPSALVMGPSSSAPTPVSSPKPSEPATTAKSDWKDALANAGSRASKEVVKNASLPVPKIPLQGGLRGLGVLGGGGGGGSYSLPAISAAGVPNTAAGSRSLNSVSAPGYKGLASRGPNVGGSGGMEGLKKGAGSAGDAFNRGSAASGLENAAATSMGSGSDSSGGAGAGGASAGEKGSSQNSNLGSRNQGESLEFLMRKQRMEKELEMYYKKLEKKDWELFGYDLGHKMVETLVTKGLVEPLATCIGGMFGGDGEKNCSWYAPKTQGMVICTKGPQGAGGKFSKKQKFCATPQGYLGTMEGSGAKDSKDVCKRIDGGPDAGYSGCSEHQVADDGTSEKPRDGRTKQPAEEAPKDDTKPSTPIVDKKAAQDVCNKLAILAEKGRFESTAGGGGEARGGASEGSVKTVAAGLQSRFGKSVAAGEAMSTSDARDTCAGKGGGNLLVGTGKFNSVHDRMVDTAKRLKEDPTGGLTVLKEKAAAQAMTTLNNVAGAYSEKNDIIIRALGDMGQATNEMNTSKTKLDNLETDITDCIAKEAAKQTCTPKTGTGTTSAALKGEWGTEYTTWIGHYQTWSAARDSAKGAADAMAAKGGAAEVKNAIDAADTSNKEAKGQFSTVGDELKIIGGYVAGDKVGSPKPDTDLDKIQKAMTEAKAAMPTAPADIPKEGSVAEALADAQNRLNNQNKENDTKLAELLERYKSQTAVMEKSYGNSKTGSAEEDDKTSYAGRDKLFHEDVALVTRGGRDKLEPDPTVTVSKEKVAISKEVDIIATTVITNAQPSVRYRGITAGKVFEGLATDSAALDKSVGESKTANKPMAGSYPDSKKDVVDGTKAAEKGGAVYKWYTGSDAAIKTNLETVVRQSGSKLQIEIQKTKDSEFK